MPQLETLKKQAKQLVRWHRDGVWTVAERIRAGLPKRTHLSDREIMEGPFSLAEAQELIAREHGHRTWSQLVASLGETPASAASTVDALQLGASEPTLFVSDFAAAVAFFEDRLGFARVFTYGQPAFFGQVRRGGALINLRYVDAPVFVADIRAREQLIAVSIAVANLKALYAEYRAAGVPFFQPLKRQPWGAQDFIVQDPDGNLIGFVFNPGPPS